MTEEYIFNEKDELEPQQIKKNHLAFFYNVTPQHFRKELSNLLFIRSFRKGFYSTDEVRKIMAALGTITRADVTRAEAKIKQYKKDNSERYQQTIEEKWNKQQ